MATKKTLKLIEESAEELLQKLQIDAKVEVVEGEEDLYTVNVATSESGLLIGFHGETLSSFQVVLGLIVYRRSRRADAAKKVGEWVKLIVEVGDYRAKRAEQLTAMAGAYANQAISTGLPVVLPPLPPSERRVVHIALQERPDVESVSEGEGNQRRVVVKPKNT